MEQRNKIEEKQRSGIASVGVRVRTSCVGLADGLADLVHQVVGELHGVGLRRRRAGRQAPLALRQHQLQLLRQRRAGT